jgi:hypothetical protein
VERRSSPQDDDCHLRFCDVLPVDAQLSVGAVLRPIHCVERRAVAEPPVPAERELVETGLNVGAAIAIEDAKALSFVDESIRLLGNIDLFARIWILGDGTDRACRC